MKAPVLYIVIPCYNEEEALPITAEKLIALTDDMIRRSLIDANSRITLVDDGSRDRTWQVVSDLCKRDKRFEGVKLAHNAGHMNALWAGMTMAAKKCDCVITIDADLQDDINAMYGFLEKYSEGADVVSGVRSSRKKDTFFKRTTALGVVSDQIDHPEGRVGLGMARPFNARIVRTIAPDSQRIIHALLLLFVMPFRRTRSRSSASAARTKAPRAAARRPRPSGCRPCWRSACKRRRRLPAALR